MGASNSNQKSSTPDPDQQTSLENQESQPSASTKRQLPPCPPVPCSCTKGGCAAACDPRETRAIPTNCCGSCEGSAAFAACGPCQVISSKITNSGSTFSSAISFLSPIPQPGACCGPPVYTSGQMPYFVPTQAPVCRPVVVNGEIV